MFVICEFFCNEHDLIPQCPTDVNCFLLGYSGTKCDQQIATTPSPLKCSDCVTSGTQYCTSNNGVFQCVCNTGNFEEKLTFFG